MRPSSLSLDWSVGYSRNDGLHCPASPRLVVRFQRNHEWSRRLPRRTVPISQTLLLSFGGPLAFLSVACGNPQYTGAALRRSSRGRSRAAEFPIHSSRAGYLAVSEPRAERPFRTCSGGPEHSPLRKRSERFSPCQNDLVSYRQRLSKKHP